MKTTHILIGNSVYDVDVPDHPTEAEAHESLEAFEAGNATPRDIEVVLNYVVRLEVANVLLDALSENRIVELVGEGLTEDIGAWQKIGYLNGLIVQPGRSALKH